MDGVRAWGEENTRQRGKTSTACVCVRLCALRVCVCVFVPVCHNPAPDLRAKDKKKKKKSSLPSCAAGGAPAVGKVETK